MNLRAYWQRLTDTAQLWAEKARCFPLLPTLAMLWARFKQDRLGLTAGSLTFTATLALVPLFTVALSVFTAFALFGRLQGALEKRLAHSLIPTGIVSNVRPPRCKPWTE